MSLRDAGKGVLLVDRYLAVGAAAPGSARQQDWAGLLSAALSAR